MESGLKHSVEITDDGNMYKVIVESDGFVEHCYVSSMHLVDEKVQSLADKITQKAREAYLQGFDDV